MSIPMVDLKAQVRDLEAELLPAIRDVLSSTRFVLGPNVKALEDEVAAYHGVRHAVGVASGTDALLLSLRAAGVGPGDEVITTPFTFFATAEVVSLLGATPVFADVEDETMNLDPVQAAARITPRTKAIVPVHIFGRAAAMESFSKMARERGVVLIEDCAQAFGASRKGKKAGTFGLAGAFSFYPSKNLGAYGDGGMVTTDDETFAGRLRVLRDHGSRERYMHEVLGYNSRLDEIQAAILRVKLKRIESYNDGRRRVAARYSRELAGVVRTPADDPDGRHVYHQYTIRTPRRDEAAKALAGAGIGYAVYYPVPLHLQTVYKDLGYKEGSLPVAERLAREVISLPIFPEMTDEQVDEVCGVVRKAVNR